jgi:hydroxymethylglutaryl-CoA reductase
MAVLHVLADPVDAMGANIMNQVCEFLKEPIQLATGETVTMCILSNLVDTKLTRAHVVMRGLEPSLIARIAEASLFAQRDPYRAATNNKGVLNGIDPILIATGNDWRAVEAGVHAYAANEGRYQSVTRWSVSDGELHGEFLAPVIVGVVGGVTKLHPTAKMCLRMLGVKTADELSRICAAVGLVQNLGALRALTTVGIIEGHMKLHIRNLTLGAGATDSEIPYVQSRLEEILALTKRISLSHAVAVLKELRAGASRPSEGEART